MCMCEVDGCGVKVRYICSTSAQILGSLCSEQKKLNKEKSNRLLNVITILKSESSKLKLL